ncbi:MAG: GMC family oxidoreductase [Actinobacteria bacterium]|nr:GMC family oxidoreductase [Actinomycetota bacterium]
MTDRIFAAGAPSVVPAAVGDTVECDLAIVGAGVGGATLAWALRDSGARILVVEQGDFLPRERENWSPQAVHREGRYKNSAYWIDDGDGKEFQPGNYHYVGGSSKLFGATMPRFREFDFETVELADGTSPAWPIRYAELEPYYCRAEELYWVHGDGDDPTEPPRSAPFPFPAVPHDPAIAKVAKRLARQGLRPYALPQSLDWRAGGRCVLCGTCDSYACMVDAKGDADVCAMRPALESDNVKLMTNAAVARIATDGSAVTGLEVVRGGARVTVKAARYALAAGAVNSAALLLRSAPDGVANRSGQVGRNYMGHVTSFIIGSRPGRDLRIDYEKTLGLNEWYSATADNPYPLGNVQSLGKLYGETIKAARPWAPLGLLSAICRRSVDFLAQSEDLPLPENRVTVDAAGRIHLRWSPTGVAGHKELVSRTARALRRAGFPFVFTQSLGIVATSHQCGTARMGEDPADSVVDPTGRTHDLANLWITDSSVFPSCAAVNPALTIAALSLRAAERGGLV